MISLSDPRETAAVKDESVKDTVIDMINYAIYYYALWCEAQAKLTVPSTGIMFGREVNNPYNICPKPLPPSSEPAIGVLSAEAVTKRRNWRAKMIGSEWIHHKTGKVYTITGYTFCGDDDKYHVVHTRQGIDTLFTRSEDNFFGLIEGGLPRFKRVEERSCEPATMQP